MATVTIRPDAILSSTGVTSGSLSSVNDASDGTWLGFGAGGQVVLSMANPTLPATAQVKQVKLSYKVQTGAGTAFVTSRLYVSWPSGAYKAFGYNYIATTTVKTFVAPTQASNPKNNPWSAADVNNIAVAVFANPGLRLIDVWIDVIYNVAPVVAVTAPSGTLSTTTRPTVTWGYCVDEATEALTQEGWKDFRALRQGDQLLTLNPKTGLSEWQPAKRISIFPAIERPMIRMEGESHSSLTTPNHRWLTDFWTRHSANGPTVSERRFTTTEKLKSQDRIPCAAPCADLPIEAKWSDDLVELVAWYWTEGEVMPSGVRITQSNKVNGPYVERIRNALMRLFGAPVETLRPPQSEPLWREQQTRPDMTRFCLNASAGRVPTSIAPKRMVSPAFIAELTRAQLELFINTSIDADGWRKPNGTRGVSQGSPGRLDALQMACSLAGIRTTIHEHVIGHWTLQMHMGTHISPRVAASHALHGRPGRFAITEELYAGHIWCPTTPNGTWLARRSGSVYWTGNTDADANAQERYWVKLFQQAEYSQAGFDPETWTASWDSGEVMSDATGAPVTANLANTITWRAYVKASDHGSNGRYSAWAFATFTTAVPIPAPPTVAVAGNADLSVTLTVTGVTAGNGVVVERSDDGGNTWHPVRGSYGWIATAGTWIENDYECPVNKQAQYRAWQWNTDGAGDVFSSNNSATTTLLLSCTKLLILDPLNPGSAFPISLRDNLKVTSPRAEQVFDPLGSPTAVVLVDATPGGDRISLALQFKTDTAYRQFMALRAAGTVLRLLTDTVDQWYVQLTDAPETETQASPDRLNRPYRTLDMTAVAVDPPVDLTPAPGS